MPSLAEYEERVKALCLRDAAEAPADAGLGDDAWRWRRYRDMVRTRLLDVVRHAFPRFEAAVSAERLAALFDRFLAANGPRSPFIRDVPSEVLDWLEATHAVNEVPHDALDLARYEWAVAATSYADDGPAALATELDLQRPATLLRAHRLLELSHAVHRDDPAPRAEPTYLCIYRDPARHDVRTLELTPSAFALLGEIATGRGSLAAAIEASARTSGAVLDRAFLEATSAVLADLVERGLLIPR